MSPETLTEIIKQLAPADYNNIIIDNASAIKKHIYCYINAAVQRVEYHTQRLSVAINSEIKKALEEILASSQRYVVINPSLIELMKSAPSINTESLLTSAKKKVNELMNRGREVDHHHLTLNMEDNRLTKQQPTFAIKDECAIRQCEDSEEMVGILSYFTPEVIDKQTSILRCLTGEIEGLKLDIQDGERRRMLTHINGIDSEDFDSDLLPYIDIVRDKVGEDNAIEDYFYQLIPCYTFTYRNVLTSELHTGILHGHGSSLRPAKSNSVQGDLQSPLTVQGDLQSPLTVQGDLQSPRLILNPTTGNNLWTSMKDSMKGISHFIGSISRSNSFKDKEDLRRTLRLLIAVVVADGIVGEEEKKSLTLAIRGFDQFTSSEKEELVKTLGAKDASFLTDKDFYFNRIENARETLTRMQELAQVDNEVHKTEREIIERLATTFE